MAVAPMYFLEYDSALVPDGGVHVVASPAPLIKSEMKDAAGRMFHEQALRQKGLLRDPEHETKAARQEEEEDVSTPTSVDYGEPEGPFKQSKGKKKSKGKKDKERDDLYDLVGLKEERWTASEKQIRDSYRKVALEKHPDKCAAGMDEAAKAKAEDHFKKIQMAYETLMDPQKRREFDSTDEFDDSLPSECTESDFFKVFGPAFLRQSRWAINKPVPLLGNPDDAWEMVDKFYDYWFSFKSWREFPHPDEEDVEQAEDRMHKRWMERENAKLRRKAEKDECKRLKEFVENAFAIDPRVVKHRQEEKEQREAKKRAKGEAARKKAEEEERLRLEEEERQRKAEEAAKAKRGEDKKEKEKLRKMLQKERKRLRTKAAEFGFNVVNDDNVEKLCSSLSFGDLQDLNTAVEDMSCPDAINSVISSHIDMLNHSAEEREAARAAALNAAEEQKKQLQAEKNEKLANEWSDEEVRMLQKAMDKFPQGTARRWEQVTDYVRTRSQDEIMVMVKVGLAARLAAKGGDEGFKVPEKRQQNREIKDEATHRLTVFSDVEVNIKGDAADALQKPSAYQKDDEKKDGAVAPETPDQASETKVAEAAESANEADAWSEVQELALVKALKTFGKDLGQERWVRVAEAVPGKNKVECFKRFKSLKEGFKAKQAA